MITGQAGSPEYEEALTRVQALGLIYQLGYYWLWNAKGWSPGKRALGLRIVRADGSPPGLGAGLARTLGSVASMLSLGAGYLWAVRDAQRQTWHDKIAHTYVVRRQEREATNGGRYSDVSSRR